MAMASFAGVDLGFIFEMVPIPSPKARQVNAYAGADGLEALDHGTRGGRTLLAGAIVSPSVPGLAAAERSLRLLHASGVASVLVDTTGTAWPDVILEAIEPAGRITRAIYPGGGPGFARQYRAQFLHLT